MKIRSYRECKKIATGHLSVRFMAASALFSFGEAALPVAQPYLPGWINPLAAALAIGACTAGALVCKIVIAQEGLGDAAD